MGWSDRACQDGDEVKRERETEMGIIYLSTDKLRAGERGWKVGVGVIVLASLVALAARGEQRVEPLK